RPLSRTPVICPVCRAKECYTVVEGEQRDFVRCRGCGLYFFNPLPSENFVEDFFTDSYITNDERLRNFFADNRDRIFKNVAATIHRWKNNGRILDVGCAGGYFLSFFFPSDRWDRWGIDLSPFLTQRAA